MPPPNSSRGWKMSHVTATPRVTSPWHPNSLTKVTHSQNQASSWNLLAQRKPILNWVRRTLTFSTWPGQAISVQLSRTKKRSRTATLSLCFHKPYSSLRLWVSSFDTKTMRWSKEISWEHPATLHYTRLWPMVVPSLLVELLKRKDR